MNSHLRTLRTLMVKDWREVRQNRGAWVPAVVVPFFFLVLIPLAVTLLPQKVPALATWLDGPEGIIKIKDYVTAFMGTRLDGLNNVQFFIVMITGYMLAPFMLIMPLMLSTIVGAESFVGERERKTLEALIYTPTTDTELFIGKVLASVVPSVVLTWLCFVLYFIVVTAASWPVMGRLWFPPATWWPLLLWLTPAVATLGMGATVLISAKMNTFMEAYQMSGSLVLVVLALVAGQISGVLFLSGWVIMLVGLAFWGIDALLLYLSIRHFNRASLLSRL